MEFELDWLCFLHLDLNKNRTTTRPTSVDFITTERSADNSTSRSGYIHFIWIFQHIFHFVHPCLPFLSVNVYVNLFYIINQKSNEVMKYDMDPFKNLVLVSSEKWKWLISLRKLIWNLYIKLCHYQTGIGSLSMFYSSR